MLLCISAPLRGVRSGEILIGQIRLEPVIGQWKEKAQFERFKEGERGRREEIREAEDKREWRKMKMSWGHVA